MLPGYSYILQLSHYSSGGVGMYIKNQLTFIERDYLSACTNDYECIWIGIDNLKQKIIIHFTQFSIDTLTAP